MAVREVANVMRKPAGAVMALGLERGIVKWRKTLGRKKKLIEVFGDHWHTGDVPYHRTEEGRKEKFSEYGFDLLVLWESEMKDLSDAEIAERIRRFNRNGKSA